MKLIIVGQFFFYGFLWASPLLEYSSMLQSSMQTIKPHNVELFNRFKKEIADSHAAVKKRLLDLSVQKTMNIDSQTKNYIQEHNEIQKAVVIKAQKMLDAHDRALLQETVMKQQSFYDDLEKYWEILAQFWQKYALPFLQTQENSTNPFKSKHAVLYEGDELSADEKKFLFKRELSVKTGIKKFFNREVNRLLRIGYAAPGGGYRAMILTSGYLAGLEDLGLLDATSYISALSGSTWFLMPWIFFNGSVRNYQNGLLNKIKNNMFNPATALFSSVNYISPDYLSALVAALWPKFLFNQQISSVDIYGSLLSYVLFSKEQNLKHVTDQWDFVKEGRVPFPLYNAVSTLSSESNNQIYYWNEFNPLEVRNISLKVAIPAYAFGSEFDDGKSKEIAPLQSLGYLLGTFGSAYLVDLIDVKKIYSALQKESENKGPELAAEYLIAATIVNLINVLPTSMYTYRVYPSFINNFCKNATSKNISLALKNADTLMYVDGGIVCNIPALPLMRKARSLQVIIIGDTSGDNPKLDQIPWELNRLFKQVRHEFGYEYNLVGEATPTIRFYKDSGHSDAPRIIYVNFVKDDALVNKGLQDPELKKIIDRGNLTKFDFNCVASYPGTFCNFLFFDYTEQQFQQLSAIAEFNIKANKQLIQQFLDKEFSNK